MLAGIIAFFNIIPGLSSMITSLSTTYFNSKVKLTTARIGGDVAVATATVKAAAIAEETRVNALKVIAGSKVLLFLTVGFALPWIGYEWKVVLWDNVFCPVLYGHAGFTPTIESNVAGWATTIITCLFGSGTVLSAGHMYFNRDKSGE